MVDQVTEILLPGRTVVLPHGGALAHASDVTLPSFVAGPENRLVATTVGALIDDNPSPYAPPAYVVPRIVALYGPSGSGKTHLARGVVRFWQDRHGVANATYFTASDFRRALLTAIDSGHVPEFRRSVRDSRLLAIDDLHQFPADDYLLQELRHTLDEYADSGGIVLVTASEPPGIRQNLTTDIRSRLSAGLILQVSAPGDAARRKIVRQIAAALQRPLNDEVADRLASGIDGTVRELFAAIFELCTPTPSAAGDDWARTDRLLATRAARRPTLREIIAVVAKYYKQPQAVLKSATRRQSAVLPRAVIIFLARELADCTYEQIGRALGGRDHTTIMHSLKKIDLDRQHDLAIQHALDDVRRILLSR